MEAFAKESLRRMRAFLSERLKETCVGALGLPRVYPRFEGKKFRWLASGIVLRAHQPIWREKCFADVTF
jgi:hypothetical protein